MEKHSTTHSRKSKTTSISLDPAMVGMLTDILSRPTMQSWLAKLLEENSLCTSSNKPSSSIDQNRPDKCLNFTNEPSEPQSGSYVKHSNAFSLTELFADEDSNEPLTSMDATLLEKLIKAKTAGVRLQLEAQVLCLSDEPNSLRSHGTPMIESLCSNSTSKKSEDQNSGFLTYSATFLDRGVRVGMWSGIGPRPFGSTYRSCGSVLLTMT